MLQSAFGQPIKPLRAPLGPSLLELSASNLRHNVATALKMGQTTQLTIRLITEFIKQTNPKERGPCVVTYRIMAVKFQSILACFQQSSHLGRQMRSVFRLLREPA
jgi:hypothetical protein